MIKAIRHYEAVAKCGHVSARHNLCIFEYKSGNSGLALQHLQISARFGLFEKSLKLVKGFFVKGIATKADYASSTNTRTDRETFMLKLFRLKASTPRSGWRRCDRSSCE